MRFIVSFSIFFSLILTFGGFAQDGMCRGKKQTAFPPDTYRCWYGTEGDDQISNDVDSNIMLNGEIIGKYDESKVNVIFGLAGSDLIESRHNKSFVIFAGSGHDLVDLCFYSGSKDINCSNPSVVVGMSGDDVILGSSGNDLLFGGDGNDLVQGFSGNDVIYGGFGNDSLYGACTNSNILYTRDDDRLFTDFYDEEVSGGFGKDEFIQSGHSRDISGNEIFKMIKENICNMFCVESCGCFKSYGYDPNIGTP